MLVRKTLSERVLRDFDPDEPGFEVCFYDFPLDLCQQALNEGYSPPMTPFVVDLREFYDSEYDCFFHMLVEVSAFDGSIVTHKFSFESNAAVMGLCCSICPTWEQ